MANKKRSECQFTAMLENEGATNDGEEDLALPGEQMQDDDQLRMEINIDKELWNRYHGECLALSPDP